MSDVTYRVDYYYRLKNLNDFMSVWFGKALFSRNRMLGFVALAIFLFATSQIGVSSFHFNWIILAITATFSGLLIYVLLPAVTWISTLLMLGLGKQRRLRRIIEITPEKLISSSEEMNVTMNWSAIHDVRSTTQTILLFTNRNCAFVVPKDAFETLAAANSFTDASTRYWKEALSGKPK